MNIYNYHPVTKELLSIEEADQSPLEPDIYLFPANSTTVVPPDISGGYKTACFDIETNQWVVIDDYREVSLYSKETKETIFASLGQTLEELNATTLKPTSDYDSWDEGTLSWVYNNELELDSIKSVVNNKIKTLLQEATDKIQVLNDAYELGIATDKEKIKLTEWKTYRVMLNRITEQENYPVSVEYPIKPE